ncbi:phosphoribosyl-AMP cyclohydrolase [Methanopyrus sp. SNP6]|uniref:phosphoribosyl-AMP cyclohydrolase n=1 Tax=Methanopyrus sp. SNP6 TaxID=1937005 RepID=UPI001AEFC781|nr:phosphoribosyl-AMP cyclohydrolase [Methanopyrus sp. SNP6]
MNHVPLDPETARKVTSSLNYRIEIGGEPLVIAITQDAENGDVLMTAFANEEAVYRTLTTGYAHYWSTSRREVWKKGEESGHVQRVVEVRVDCDKDAVLYVVEQEGGACHTGYRSCFYRRVTRDGSFEVVMDRVFSPDEVYR